MHKDAGSAFHVPGNDDIGLADVVLNSRSHGPIPLEHVGQNESIATRWGSGHERSLTVDCLVGHNSQPLLKPIAGVSEWPSRKSASRCHAVTLRFSIRLPVSPRSNERVVREEV